MKTARRLYFAQAKFRAILATVTGALTLITIPAQAQITRVSNISRIAIRVGGAIQASFENSAHKNAGSSAWPMAAKWPSIVGIKTLDKLRAGL